MCHILTRETDHAYVKANGLYWGLKAIDVHQGELWPVISLTREYGPYKHTVFGDYIMVTHNETPTQQLFISQILIANNAGVARMDVTCNVEAGMHVSPMIYRSDRNPRRWNLSSRLNQTFERGSHIVFVPVLFGYNNILFADGMAVSVSSFGIPSPDYWKETADEIREILWSILTSTSKKDYNRWVKRLAGEVEDVYSKLVPEV